MDVTVTETNTFDREITIRIDASRVDALLEQELAHLLPKARLPGFRPGKIPKAVLETRFRDQISQAVVEQLIRETYLSALEERDLRPVDNEPKLILGKVQRGEPYTYTAHIQIYPTVDPKDYTGLTVDHRRAEVTAADVDAVVQQLRLERSTFTPEADRTAEMGDRLLLDFDGRIDGERFAGGQANGHLLELGSNRFIDTFEAQLVGCRAGDARAVTVRFPEVYQASELAGKEATFDCTIHEVQQRVLPPEDDGLAALAGLKEGGLAGLRTEIEQTLRRQAEHESKQQLKKAILDQLLAANPMELPPLLVQRTARSLLAQAKRDYERRHGALPDVGIPEEQLAAQFTEQAQAQATLGLLLAEIADREKLVVDEAVVEARLDAIGEAYGERASAMKQWVRNNEERMDALRASVLEEQVIDWICQHSTLQEKSVSFDELMGNDAGTGTPAAG
ncbi:MAG: trigger factor [Magnetococcales bacterium]|nr:trigger factor [Magnetococcales bacterium]